MPDPDLTSTDPVTEPLPRRRRVAKKAAEPITDAVEADAVADGAAIVVDKVAKKAAKRVRKAAPATAPDATAEAAAHDEAAPAAEPVAAAPTRAPAKRTRAPAKAARAAEAAAAAQSAAAPEPAGAAEPAADSAVTSARAAGSAASSAVASAGAAEPEADSAAAEAPALRAPRRVARRSAAPAVAFIAPEPEALLLPPARALPDVPPVPPAPPAPSASAEPDEVADGDRPTRRRGRRGRGRGRGADSAEGDGGAGGSEAAGQPPTGDPGEIGHAGGPTAPGSPDLAARPAMAATSDGTAPAADGTVPAADGHPADADAADSEDSTSTRRRRRRRRSNPGEPDAEETTAAEPPAPTTRARKTRAPRGRDTEDEVQGVKGSVRLEAKRQRRRDGRDQSRRRPPIITESEFLARREAVDRTMVVRQVADRTQIAVLEDGALVEHYVTKASASAYAGNVYLGKVQNVLPSMEAAFVDIGKSRNAVLYAGEVNWDAAGIEGRARRIEDALKGGQSVLCQVTKDPVGQKGARLTSQISLPGRFLVYVPQGQMTGISRKLPDVERKRLKDILKNLVPDEAGVIIRTAAEGASEEELTSDVERLQAQWAAISAKAAKASAPALLYGEPDLVIRVVRDIFNEDFTSLVVAGDAAWEQVSEYVHDVSPDLVDRLSRHEGDSDVFADLRIDEQLAKGLDRKVFLPSGGSLVIDRTEAMTVVDVNTGKFIGKGGNLEETVTRNNLEAAEEIVRQLRLRDIGGMIVIDFIDMILESNRDLVLRRLTECLGRDRTRHQVAEVTSLGLVQMTRKRVGQGLLEAFSEPCETCQGRGLIVHMEPVEHSTTAEQRHDAGEPVAHRRRPAGPPPGLEAVAAATSRLALSTPVVVPTPDGELPKPVVVDEPADGALPVTPAGVPEDDPLPDAPTGQPEVDGLSTAAPPADQPKPAQSEGRGPAPAIAPAAAALAPRRRRAASRPAGPPVEAAEPVTIGG